MKTALITGSKGFIGKNLIKKLSETDRYLIIEINEDIFEDENWDLNLWSICLDNKPDVIFHVGACSDTLEKDVNYMMKLNFEFTKILSDYSKSNNSKMVYSSSAANYGENNKYPSNLYGWSKYVAEKYVIANGGIALRYFNVYGPGEEHKGKMSSVAYQSYLKQKKGEDCVLFPLNPTRDFVYVKDVIDANLYAEKNYKNLKNNFYDVGSGESRSFEDVLYNMGISYRYCSEKNIPEGYQFYTCSDKNKWMPGWKSIYPLEKGISEYRNYLELSM